MISLWGAILLAFGFTIWSIFCVLLGAGLKMSADKKIQPPVNPKMN